MTDTTNDRERDDDGRACTVCKILHPDTTPRLPTRPPVCESDRGRLARWLHEISGHHAQLTATDDGPDRPAWVEWSPADQRADLYPLRHPRDDNPPPPLRRVQLWSINSGPVPAKRIDAPVTGSRECPAPADLDAVDLADRVRPEALQLWGGRDQVGHLSVATVLDAWATIWQRQLFPTVNRPVPTVNLLTRWLADRVDAACEHPEIGKFASDVKDLRHALRAALGETTPRPERIIGVACGACDTMALVRPDDAGDSAAECGSCGALFGASALADLESVQAARERSKRRDVAAPR